MSADVIPWTVFREAREKKLDPKGYEAKKIHEAIDRQVKASEPLLVKDTPVLDSDFDIEDVPVMDRALYWGPEFATPKLMLLTRYFSERQREQSDPGDEIDD